LLFPVGCALVAYAATVLGRHAGTDRPQGSPGSMELSSGRDAGIEPHQPVPRGIATSTVVRLACAFTVDVCSDVQAYAHRPCADREHLARGECRTLGRVGALQTPRSAALVGRTSRHPEHGLVCPGQAQMLTVQGRPPSSSAVATVGGQLGGRPGVGLGESRRSRNQGARTTGWHPRDGRAAARQEGSQHTHPPGR
jgi:hypothetical protein